MDFRQMHYIQTIAQEGTISRAAQKLFISQPSLSQLLRGVEQKVGAPLFDRGTSPLQPTAVGRLYLRMAAQMAQLRTDFQQQTDDLLHQSRGRVIIGSSPFRSAYLLAPFLPGLQACYPELEIQLKESTISPPPLPPSTHRASPHGPSFRRKSSPSCPLRTRWQKNTACPHHRRQTSRKSL